MFRSRDRESARTETECARGKTKNKEINEFRED